MAPMAPITPVPTRATTPSLQLASLATATCLLRRGVIQRDQAIGSAGGCTVLLERMQNAGPGDSRVVQVTYLSPSSGGSSFSEREGFGLAPYR